MLTKEEIMESNKLIAEFMGFKYYPFVEGSGIAAGWKIREDINPAMHGKIQRNCYLGRTHSDLRYYNSWDWLMPVVQKIETKNIPDFLQKSFDGTINTDIKVSYGLVMEFIRWYNK